MTRHTKTALQSGGMYYVYVIRSEKDGQLYTGYTNGLRRRFAEHKRV